MVLIAIVFHFQNCDSGTSIRFDNSNKSILTSNENAGTFDGKPDPGTYIRTFPNQTCPQTLKNVQSVIEVTLNTITLVEDNCDTVNYPIPANDPLLIKAKTNNKYFTFLDGIFEKINSFDDWAGNPMPLSESFCRFSDSANVIEVVVHANESQTLRSAEIYLNSKFVNPFSVTYQNQSGQISYSSTTQAFDLTIAGSRGTLAANIDGNLYNANMECKTLNSSPTLSVSRSNLVGYWNFDGPNGSQVSSVVDLSGSGNDGAVVTPATTLPSYVLGNFGNAIFFDNSEGIRINSNPTLNNLPQLSVSAWINPNDVTSSTLADGIMSKFNIGTYTGWFFELSQNSLHFFAGTSPTNLDVLSVGAVNANQWQHVAVTWDGTGDPNGVHLYLNGVELTKSIATGTPGARRDDSAVRLTLGTVSETGGQPFGGSIDEPMLFNRVLSSSEIQALKINGPAGLK
jgi:hypothetical protein